MLNDFLFNKLTLKKMKVPQFITRLLMLTIFIKLVPTPLPVLKILCRRNQNTVHLFAFRD